MRAKHDARKGRIDLSAPRFFLTLFFIPAKQIDCLENSKFSCQTTFRWIPLSSDFITMAIPTGAVPFLLPQLTGKYWGAPLMSIRDYPVTLSSTLTSLLHSASILTIAIQMRKRVIEDIVSASLGWVD